MLIFENSNLEIHDVGSSTDPTLIPIEVTDGTFDGWSVAKICCYRAQVVDGNVVMLTPYVDSRLIEHIDQLGKQIESVTPYKETKTAYYGESEKTFYDVPDGNVSVFFDRYNGAYSVNRIGNRLIVSFNTLERETNITISIQ